MIRSMLYKNTLAIPSWQDGRTCIRGIIGQVQEQGHTLHTSILLEVLGEESTRLQVDTHRSEHDGEIVLMVVMRALVRALHLHQTRLPTYLRCDLVVRETCCREDGDLLPTGDGIHGVDGGDTGGDHLFGIDAGVGVDGRAVDVEVVLREHFGAFVDGAAGAVEDAAQHVFADAELEVVAGEFDSSLEVCQCVMLLV